MKPNTAAFWESDTGNLQKILDRIEELEDTMHSFNPNVVRRLMCLEEALGICEECGASEGKHKMGCNSKTISFDDAGFDHVMDSMSYSFIGAEQGKFHTPADELKTREVVILENEDYQIIKRSKQEWRECYGDC